MSGRKDGEIFKFFKEIYRYYLQRGFRIDNVQAYGELQLIQELIQGMTVGPVVNLMSANEKVPDIEWTIRVIKEKIRATRQSPPFNRIPKLMTINGILNIGKMLDYFMTKAGVSTTMIPRAILNGKTWITTIICNCSMGSNAR